MGACRSKWREEIAIIIKSLMEGRKTNAQLARKVGKLNNEKEIPEPLRKRVERHLKQLEKWELVKEDSERQWCWYTHVRNFQNWSEYIVWLSHSRQLLEALEMLAEIESPMKSNPLELKLLPYAEEHLKTGYPNIHFLLCEFRRREKELQEEKRRLKEKVLERATNKFAELMDRATGPRKETYVGDNIPEAVYRNLHARLKGYPSSMLWIDKQDDSVCYGDIVIGKGSEKVFRPLEEFIEAEGKEESNVKKVERIIILETKNSTVGSELAAKIRELALTVRHGTPLEGECPVCPRLTIVHA